MKPPPNPCDFPPGQWFGALAVLFGFAFLTTWLRFHLPAPSLTFSIIGLDAAHSRLVWIGLEIAAIYGVVNGAVGPWLGRRLWRTVTGPDFRLRLLPGGRGQHVDAAEDTGTRQIRPQQRIGADGR